MRRIVLPLLAVLLLGATGFGVAQFNEVRRLRAELSGLGKDRDELRKKLWERQKPDAVLAAEPAQERPPPAGQTEEERGGTDPAMMTAVAPPERMRPDGGRFNAIMNSPEVQQLMAIQQKAGLDGRYAALFKRLNLSPADLETFKNLLVEKQAVVMDAMAAARSQGLGGRDGRDEIRQAVQDARMEIDEGIRATLGESVYAQYKTYESTLPQRSVVDQLSQRLSYSTTPLSDTQTDQLVQILAATAPAGPGGNRNQAVLSYAAAFPRVAMTSNGPVGGVRITDEAVAQAQGVLSGQQVAALQSLQQEQQAAARLMEQVRASRRGAPTSKPAPPNPGGG